jgi:hypothetical protein
MGMRNDPKIGSREERPNKNAGVMLRVIITVVDVHRNRGQSRAIWFMPSTSFMGLKTDVKVFIS